MSSRNCGSGEERPSLGAARVAREKPTEFARIAQGVLQRDTTALFRAAPLEEAPQWLLEDDHPG